MAVNLAAKARGAAVSVAGAARHFAWYLRYCVDASATRGCERPPGERSDSGAAARRVS
ncbi:MAG: hypothetical protein M3088_01565 [Actinomycetota bacterium]|nr:hypothetical protein [Actinomycetota bacterium]